jgi:hypothetical protein
LGCKENKARFSGESVVDSQTGGKEEIKIDNKNGAKPRKSQNINFFSYEVHR